MDERRSLEAQEPSVHVLKRGLRHQLFWQDQERLSDRQHPLLEDPSMDMSERQGEGKAPGGSLKGKYLPKKQLQLAVQLAQKDYDSQLMPLLRTEITALQNYLRATRNCTNIPKLYNSLCPSRRALIQPVTLPDEQYAAQWQAVQYKGLPFEQDAPVYTTARDERVRSKSEVIIADALLRHGIPYRYEFPLKLNKGRQTFTFYPDFLCLNIRTRQEFLWEHFGMMDDPAYAQKATAKLRLYEENGILPGRNLLLTMETQTEPLSTRAVEKIISEFLSGES